MGKNNITFFKLLQTSVISKFLKRYNNYLIDDTHSPESRIQLEWEFDEPITNKRQSTSDVNYFNKLTVGWWPPNVLFTGD